MKSVPVLGGLLGAPLLVAGLADTQVTGRLYTRIVLDGEVIAESAQCREETSDSDAWLRCRSVAPTSKPSPTTPTTSRRSRTRAPIPSASPTETPARVPTPAPPPPDAGPFGYGATTRGGETDLPGRPHDVYQVTNLDNGGPGSLREGILERKGPRIIQFKVGGTLVLRSALRIGEPYLTIDGSTATSPGLTISIDQGGKFERRPQTDPEFKIVATHDIIIRGIRVAGTWVPGRAGVSTATVAVDGDGGHTNVRWDPNPQACGPTPQHLRNSCRIILDGNTLSGAVDSGTDFWCGIKDLTFSRNLVIDSYHPRGTGCKGTYPERHPHARARITEYANVYAYNGERTPKLNEGVYDYDFINNIVAFWQDYGSAAGKGPGGYGSMWDDDGAEDRHNVLYNVWLPGGGPQPEICAQFPDRRSGSDTCRETRDCQWGGLSKCDGNTKLQPYPSGCERLLREDGLHYAGNVFAPKHNPHECVSTARGQQPFPRPYTLNPYPTAELEAKVLAVVGAPYRTPREQAVIAEVAKALRERPTGDGAAGVPQAAR